MNTNTIKRKPLTAALLISTLALLLPTDGAAADKAIVKLACDFPAAEAPQKIKPGAKNVSDGVVRITPMQPVYEICDGCPWNKDEKGSAKWKVTPTEYRVAGANGVAVKINRKDGTALFSVTTKPDEYYQSGHVESRGRCQEIGGK